jgi:CDP-diacylglycerol--glycerol-3-phosphate 3-phosphatidyltransferase
VAPLARTGITPNGLTVMGLVLNVVAGAVLASGSLVLGGVLVLIAGAFDMFDGALARVKNQKTEFGGFFDSTMDRYSEAAVFFGLQIAFLRTPDAGWLAYTGVALCYLVMIGSIMISYARARAEGMVPRVNCEVGLLQRPERIILLGAGLLLTAVDSRALIVILVVLAVLTQVTVLQRIAHVRRVTSEGRG